MSNSATIFTVFPGAGAGGEMKIRVSLFFACLCIPFMQLKAVDVSDCDENGGGIVPGYKIQCLSDEKIMENVKREAMSGDAESAMLLAIYYRDNLGDAANAIEWVRIAAASGGAEYLYTLAWWLSESKDGVTNIREARGAAELAANKGHVQSALLLGDLWLRDGGDVGKARGSYLKAIRLGDKDAMLRMSVLERLGRPDVDKLMASAAWLKAYLLAGAPNKYIESRVESEFSLLMERIPANSRGSVVDMANDLLSSQGRPTR